MPGMPARAKKGKNDMINQTEEHVWIPEEDRIVTRERTYSMKKGTISHPLTEAPVEKINEFYTREGDGVLVRAYELDSSDGKYISAHFMLLSAKGGYPIWSSFYFVDKHDHWHERWLLEHFIKSNSIPIMSAEDADAIYGEGDRPYPERKK